MWALGWLVCTHKVCLLVGKLFTICRNWPMLGGSDPPSQQGPKMSIKITRMKRHDDYTHILNGRQRLREQNLCSFDTIYTALYVPLSFPACLSLTGYKFNSLLSIFSSDSCPPPPCYPFCGMSHATREPGCWGPGDSTTRHHTHHTASGQEISLPFGHNLTLHSDDLPLSPSLGTGQNTRQC